jgi:hypothetical protein
MCNHKFPKPLKLNTNIDVIKACSIETVLDISYTDTISTGKSLIIICI